MLIPAPQVPTNLEKKLLAAVRPFQREYDGMSLGDARRLLARHDFGMPVLCSLVFHGNGTLKRVKIRENLKNRAASSRQIAAHLRILGSPEQGARDLWSPCLRHVVEDAARTMIQKGQHQALRVSDAEIEERLRSLPEYRFSNAFNHRDASPLVLRRVLETERDLRVGETNHERLHRRAKPVPDSLIEELEAERKSALAWRDDQVAQGYTPYHSFEYSAFPEEERVILAYREDLYREASR